MLGLTHGGIQDSSTAWDTDICVIHHCLSFLLSAREGEFGESRNMLISHQQQKPFRNPGSDFQVCESHGNARKRFIGHICVRSCRSTANSSSNFYFLTSSWC